jgi:hypothetical protein
MELYMSPAEKHELIYELMSMQLKAMEIWPDRATRVDALTRLLVSALVGGTETPQALAARGRDTRARFDELLSMQLIGFHAVKSAAEVAHAQIFGGNVDDDKITH